MQLLQENVVKDEAGESDDNDGCLREYALIHKFDAADEANEVEIHKESLPKPA